MLSHIFLARASKACCAAIIRAFHASLFGVFATKGELVVFGGVQTVSPCCRRLRVSSTAETSGSARDSVAALRFGLESLNVAIRARLAAASSAATCETEPG